MRNGLLIILLLALLASITSGCALVSHGRMGTISPSHVEAIKVGSSTKEDVIKLLGQPQRVMYKPNDIAVFIYSHGLERSFTIPFLISWSRAGGTGQTLNVSFQNDLVVDYEYITDDRAMIQ